MTNKFQSSNSKFKVLIAAGVVAMVVLVGCQAAQNPQPTDQSEPGVPAIHGPDAAPGVRGPMSAP